MLGMKKKLFKVYGPNFIQSLGMKTILYSSIYSKFVKPLVFSLYYIITY